MTTRSDTLIDDIRQRLLAQLDSHGDSAIVPMRELTAWVVRCRDFKAGAVYRWAIVGLDDMPRADTTERFTACDQAARALVAAIGRATENAA